MFFRDQRDLIRSVHMLASTAYIRMSAEMVRSFSQLDERMHVLTDVAEFERRVGARVLAG